MSDGLLQEAERHREHDHARDETLEHVRRFVEVLAADEDPGRREVAAELIEIVGTPEGETGVDLVDERNGAS